MKNILLLAIIFLISCKFVQSKTDTTKLITGKYFIGGILEFYLNNDPTDHWYEGASIRLSIVPKFGYRINDYLSVTLSSGLSIHKNVLYKHQNPKPLYYYSNTHILDQNYFHIASSLIYDIQVNDRGKIFTEIEVNFTQPFRKNSLTTGSNLDYYHYFLVPTELFISTKMGYNYKLTQNLEISISVIKFNMGYEIRGVDKIYSTAESKNLWFRKSELFITPSKPQIQIYYNF